MADAPRAKSLKGPQRPSVGIRECGSRPIHLVPYVPRAASTFACLGESVVSVSSFVVAR